MTPFMRQTHHTRRTEQKQLDDGIGDTLVSDDALGTRCFAVPLSRSARRAEAAIVTAHQAAVSGAEFSQAVALPSEGNLPATGSRISVDASACTLIPPRSVVRAETVTPRNPDARAIAAIPSNR